MDYKSDTKIFECIPRSWLVPIKHRALEEIFKTKDGECIYSRGYPSACNFEFYPYKSVLKILYPFPTSKELKELGIEKYEEHCYGTRWHDIAPDLIPDMWKSIEEEEEDLKISEGLHESLINFFIKELEDNHSYTKDDTFYSIFAEELGHLFDDYGIDSPEKLNEMVSKGEVDDSPFCTEKILKMYLECLESNEAKGKISLSKCSAQRKINSDGFLDIELLINLSKLDYEMCSIICSEEMGYSISSYFELLNGIEGYMCDGEDYGLYVNLNLNETDLIKAGTHFPWTRCLAVGDPLVKDALKTTHQITRMKPSDIEFMWRPELIDSLYEASEINLKRSFVNPINDPLDLSYINISKYLKLYMNQWNKRGIYWGEYAFLEYEDKKTIKGKEGIFFTESEKAFLKKMKEAHNIYSKDCLTSPYYDCEVFDATQRAFITPDKSSRVVMDIGVPSFGPKSIDELDLSKLEPFQLPKYINAVEAINAEQGFYACYDNLDLLTYFEDLCPNGDHVQYNDDENAYIKAKKQAAKNFVKDEIFSKFINDIGPIDSLKFILVHHCHSLSMLLTAKDTSWKIYQNFHVIAYDDKKCMAYGFDTISE